MLKIRICTFLLFACLASTTFVSAADSSRPNFLFIYTDDQRWDALGVVQREHGDKARFPWIESPNLDKLAADGVRFRNAFVVTSLCSPSRAAFLTGLYGHENGVVNNHTAFAEQSVTHATLLRAAGYRTGYVGKWHMGSQSGQRPGFDYSASFIGQGKYFDCPIEVNGVSQPSQGWVDDVSTDFALKFLQENKSGPFALVLGFKTCHGPFTPPPRTENAYGDADFRAVPNLKTPAIYAEVDPKRSLDAKKAETRTNLGYFRGLRAIDENVGKLLKKLDELQLTENTVVIYSSDNGYYLGEHRLGDKRTAYEESLRIPLLLRFPKLGLKGKTIDKAVLNIDLCLTLLDLAGVAIPAKMQGRSWRPLLQTPPSDWRTSFFYSYFREGKGGGAPTVTAVRTEAAKLIKYPGHDEWTEMFDLVQDPYETKNLASALNHADLRKSLEAEYDRQAKAVHYHVPDFADEKQDRTQGGAPPKRKKKKSCMRSAMNALMNRRNLLMAAVGTTAALATHSARAQQAVEPDFKITNKRIRQSVMGWCFNPMPAEELARHCRDIGLEAIEGIGAEHYPAVRKLGLKISLVGSHGFARGPFSPANHEFCISKLRTGIDLAVENQCENVITFTGMREKGISDEQGAKNCIECWKQVIAYAEEKKVNLCLEHLNTRDSSHPMKGHPGYFGDDVDFCVDLIRRVDSPRMKLLFDIYHVQIMNGDVIRRLRQYKDVIAHYHTAGNPGRCELDEKQEINYPAIMQAILDTGYKGYVAQEFIPTWTDKIAALRHAAKVCDV